MSSGDGTGRRRKSRTQSLRDAKMVGQQLKAALNAGNDPSNRDVEDLRRSLRDHYLAFFFDGRSLSVRAADVVNLMWIDCSHALIKRHRDRITKLDAQLEKNDHSRKQRTETYSASGEGAVARRKQVHALRAFLTQEEGFWSSFIARIISTFNVTRAAAAAATLKLYPRTGNYMHADQLEEADQALPLVQVALVFYGDLARYSELYRDAQQGGPRRFERAAECYHQARLLIPSSGQPDHQLAVIASGRNERLAAAFHYMRALAVRSSFATARSNLEITYRQAVAEHRDKRKARNAADAESTEDAPRAFILLLAALVIDSSVPFADGEVAEIRFRFNESFGAALESRLLSSENIIRILLLAISTWWDARLSNDSALKTFLALRSFAEICTGNKARKRNELLLLELLLDIVLTLFRVSASLTAACMDPSGGKLHSADPLALMASHISAPVRRIAPALRITSIWMLGNLDQISRSHRRDAFWSAYAKLVEILMAAFPPHMLPTLPSGCNLEEDFELLAFLPCPLPPGSAATPYIAEHPNSEFFFRVSSFVSDATLASEHSATIQSGLDDPDPAAAENDPRLNIPYEDDADILAEVMDAARLSDSYALDEDDEDEILYKPQPLPRLPSPAPSVAAPPTAQDLLSSMLRGESALVSQTSIWAPQRATASEEWSRAGIDRAWAPSSDPWVSQSLHGQSLSK